MDTMQNLDRLDEIIERLESITNIPTMPVIATRAMAATRDPDSSMRDIAEIISMDPPLAAKVLKIVNSAYYCLSQSVGSLPLALTILGIREIMNVVMSVTVMTMFPKNSVGGFFDPHQFWKHSAECAQVGKILCEKLGFNKYSTEAFVGGLIHDVGKILMDEYMHEEYREAMELTLKEGLPSHDAESMTIGVTHTQLGAWLTRKWNLPDMLVDSISTHHSPEKIGPDDTMKQIVYISNEFCNALSRDKDSEKLAAFLNEDSVWNDCIKKSGKKIKLELLIEHFIQKIDSAGFLLV